MVKFKGKHPGDTALYTEILRQESTLYVWDSFENIEQV